MLFTRPPVRTRRHIPFYTDKSEAAFRLDPYEQYETMVVRQTHLHLTPGPYAYQPVLDWIWQQLPERAPLRLLDLGCGVGRLVGELAQHYPTAEAIGVDYSYQLLRRAREYWLTGQKIEVDMRQRGWPIQRITGRIVPNLQFLLAQAEDLPLAPDSIDIVVSTFALDRFADPARALRDMQRILRPGGRLLLVSPLNFQQATHWEAFHPLEQLAEHLRAHNWQLHHTQQLRVPEPLDAHDNQLIWQCAALAATRP